MGGKCKAYAPRLWTPAQPQTQIQRLALAGCDKAKRTPEGGQKGQEGEQERPGRSQMMPRG